MLSTAKNSRLEEAINRFSKFYYFGFWMDYSWRESGIKNDGLLPSPVLDVPTISEYELQKILLDYYDILAQHIYDLTNRWEVDIKQKRNLHLDVIRLYADAYGLLSCTNLEAEYHRQAGIKELILFEIKFVIEFEKILFPKNEYTSDSVLSYRQATKGLISRKLGLDSELLEDPDINKMIDDFVDDAKKNSCYIATATMGDKNNPQVIILRDFRDNVLSCSKLGSIFICNYYRISPTFAKMIAHHKFLQLFSKWGIVLPVSYVTNLITLSITSMQNKPE